MGCVYSSVEKEESVRRCRERKRLMKLLISCRSELASAHLAYLQSLRNTGATLRQFAEDGSVSPVCPAANVRLPRSPLPPPPPPFSPERGGDEEEQSNANEKEPKDLVCLEAMSSHGEGVVDTIDGSSGLCTPPPPPSWDIWDPFDPPSSPIPAKKRLLAEAEVVEEEDWAETHTEFVEEEENGDNESRVAEVNLVLNSLLEKSKGGGGHMLADDNSSLVSGFTKDTDMAMVVWRNSKTLAGITRELDEYFLKASAGGTQVISLLDSNKTNCLNIGKRSKSAKVFSSLSWRWSSRSPLSSKDACEFQGSCDPCQSGSHCMTLDKLYAEEQRLYKVVKDEEVTKMHRRKKILLLHKQEARDQDSTIIENTRAKIEELDNRIRSLQESINETCLCISKLRDEELYPQIIALSSRLLKMWRTMYQCHQVQNHVSQQANHLDSHHNNEPTSDSHHHATLQLETEINSWHNAFHKLLKSQRGYAHILNQWVRLTDCLPDNQRYDVSHGIYALCEEWQVALDRLPDKVAAEAIKSFISIVHSIDLQLVEEHALQKRVERLEKRLEKKTALFGEFNSAYEENVTSNMAAIAQPNMKKLDSLRTRVAEEKSKYLSSIHKSRAMMLNNLQTGLPNVFQAMTGFAGICVQAFESISLRSGMTASQGTCNSPL